MRLDRRYSGARIKKEEIAMPQVRVTLSCEIDPDLYNERVSQGWTEKDFIDEVVNDLLSRGFEFITDMEVRDKKFIRSEE